jgi:hypothetical protein
MAVGLFEKVVAIPRCQEDVKVGHMHIILLIPICLAGRLSAAM